MTIEAIARTANYEPEKANYSQWLELELTNP
jgi:hypothetical protein